MKYTSFLVSLLVFIAQGVCAQQIVFKDKNLKSALLNKGYDFNKNGEIEVSEIDTVSKLNIAKCNIKSLDDLRAFKSLKAIYAMDNHIGSLDVFFDNNTIEEIYIGGNSLGGKLTLKNIKNLTDLAAAQNSLEEIELVGTDNVKFLSLQNNAFKKIDLRNLANLNTLELIGNKELKSIRIDSNPSLTYLCLLSTAVTRLDITHNKLLNTLYVAGNVAIIKENSQAQFKPAPIVKEIH
ncbi:hypothetical protein SNE26_13420 [Mucilaginibacter sp. cycad4]|uniref:hypothetical protein n=1 Tax=Mucilaginibacter sp. cycad4 TaxID=3342096 RepID=UPI002AAC4677|nr:hypothetical protein [Mucilaginibacter gossypii]WPV02781.1 hypothetical protein SNE26_13420 [Mucilaginibacter gossypii]